VTNKVKAENVAQVTTGRLKKVAGETTGDDPLEADERTDQMKGNFRQGGEKVSDAFKR
jgi:uncharacterized protein YjbJ (UPF0337 family)